MFDVKTPVADRLPTIRTDATLVRAAHLLARNGGEELIVVTPAGRAVGRLSHRDVLEALTRPGVSLESLDVVDAMRTLQPELVAVA